MLVKRITWIAICLLSISMKGFGQAPIIEPEIEAMMDEAISFMDQGQFEKANLSFRKMLSTKKVLPTNMSYLFAETLYMIKQFHNSENFIGKYIELAGKGGDYYDQAIELQGEINKEKKDIDDCQYCNVFGYRLKSCQLCQGKGTMTSTCYYCKGLGKTNCLTCLGDGIIITKNIFDVEEYKSCHVCETKGFNVCKVCNGNKIIDNQCPDCLGSKFTQTKTICDHEPSEHEHNHNTSLEN